MPTSSKAVNVWTWRRMLRDYSPLQQSTLLTMLVISTYMDANGFTYVGQARVAKGARASVRTVKRHIEAASRFGWLHVELTRVSSKASRHTTFMNNYRASVPENIELSDVDEELAEVVLREVGELQPWRPEPDERGAIAMAPPPASRDEGGDTQSRGWGHPASEVVSPSVEGGDIAMAQELFSINSSVLTHQSEGALARTPAVDKSTKAKTKTEELTHISAALPVDGASHEESSTVKTETKPAMRSREEQSAILRKMIGTR